MLSVVVFPSPPAAGRPPGFGGLVRTLAALVPATVEGVVRDVTLIDVGRDGEIARIAEEAGCGVVSAQDAGQALMRAAEAARTPMVLVIRAGAAPMRSFGEEVARALEEAPQGDARCLLRVAPIGLWARLVPSLAPVAGVVLPRSRLLGRRCAEFKSVIRLARPAPSLPSPARFFA